jgi:hypothetical protein
MNLILIAVVVLPSGLTYGQQDVISRINTGGKNLYTQQVDSKADQSKVSSDLNNDQNAILLRSRQFTPQPGVETAQLKEYLQVAGIENDRVHILLQLYGPPRSPIKEEIEAKEITLLNYIPRNTWFASIPVNGMNFKLRMLQNAGIIRWAGKILPEDKVHTDLWNGNIGDWARVDNDRILIEASFFEDGVNEIIESVIENIDGEIISESPLSKKFILSIPSKQVNTLASIDSVRWMDQISPKTDTYNRKARRLTNVNKIQSAPYSLSGEGIVVGIWDDGAVDWTHPDFMDDNGQTRITVRTSPVSDHATFVGGRIAGDGSMSEYFYSEFEPGELRGMAPNSTLISYNKSFNTRDDYPEAIDIYDIDLSNNSWGWAYNVPDLHCYKYGNYAGEAPDFDRIVRGELGKRIPIIFAAGNERNEDHCDSYKPYGNLPPPGGTAKNTITVGAVASMSGGPYTKSGSIYTGSSFGPTDDGRIKPELVAPGTGAVSPIPYTCVDDFCSWYDVGSGTSGAAPVVSGIIALLIEQYQDLFGPGNPWPMTIKALLVQSALDLDDADFGDQEWYTPGPDYASGYGLVDAKAAADLIRSRSFMQGTIPSIGVVHQHEFWVPPGRDSIKVTLAWDDLPGTDNATDHLVNDLDLEIRDPNNQRHEPWILNRNEPEADATRGRNNRDNLEQVVVTDPQGLQPGKWVVRVTSENLQQSPQEYALVSDLFFNILSPNDGQQVYGGSSAEPQQLFIEIPLVTEELSDNYRVEIGGQQATINYLEANSDSFVLGILPSPVPSDGVYDLLVIENSRNIQAVREDAILFDGVSISGYVKDHDGIGMEGVLVNAGKRNNGTFREDLTDQDGFYRIEGIPPGTYSVIPQSSTHTFTPRTSKVSNQDVTLADFIGVRVLDGIVLVSDLIDIPLDGSTVAHLTATVQNSLEEPVVDTPVYFHTSQSGSIISPVSTDSYGRATTTFTPDAVETVHITATTLSGLQSNMVHLEVHSVNDSLHTELELRLHEQSDTESMYDINGKSTFIANGTTLDHTDIQYTVLDEYGNLFGTLEGGHYSQVGNPITDRTDNYGRSSVYLRVTDNAQVTIRVEVLGNRNSLVSQVQAGFPQQESLSIFNSLSFPGDITDLAMSADGTALVATSGNNRSAMVFDASNYQYIQTFVYPEESFRPALAADVADDRSYIAIGTDDAASMNSGLIYDGSTYDFLRGVHYGSEMGQVIDVAISPSGDRLLTLDDHGNLYAQVWKTSDASLDHTFSGWLNTQELMAGDWSVPSSGYPRGLIAIAHRKYAGYIINGQSYARIATFDTNFPEDMQWSRDGENLAVVDYVTSMANNIKIIDRSGDLVTTLPQNFGLIFGLDWAHNSPHIAAACEFGKVTIWNTDSGLLERILIIGQNVTDVQWSANDSEIFVAYENGDIGIYALDDDVGPEISISSPSNNSTTTSSSITVKGQIIDPHLVHSPILIHNDSQPMDLSLDQSGKFSREVALGEGINIIRIEATDGSDFMSFLELKVTRLPEPPLVNLHRVYLPVLAKR